MMRFDHRISAGGIVVVDDKIFFVPHHQEGEFDFWVLPGGGLEADEGFMRAAEREVLEETNLVVKAEKIAYVQDFIDQDRYVCKFWVVCRLLGGELTINNKVADESFLRDAGFFSKEDIQEMNVFPEILKDLFWQDQANDFPQIRYLGYSM